MKRKLHVFHLRTDAGQPFATIAMTDRGSLGVAIPHAGLDTFVRREGVRRAVERALAGEKALLGVNPQPLNGRRAWVSSRLEREARRLSADWARPDLGKNYFSYEVDDVEGGTGEAQAQPATQ